MTTVRILRWAAPLVVVLLLCGSGTYLVQPSTVQAADPSPSMADDLQQGEPGSSSQLEDLYEALRPESLRTESGDTTFEHGGSAIGFEYDLVNRSDGSVVFPYLEYGDSWFYLAGTEQTWIERLGRDPSISCVPEAGRKGTWYAAGGQLLVAGEPVTLGPGESLARHTRLPASTTACFEAGKYRYHIEYKPLDGGLDDVIAEVTVDLTFEEAGPAAPTPRPSHHVRSPKPTTPPTSTLDAPVRTPGDRLLPGLLAAVAGVLLATVAERRRVAGRSRP
jgi:hypothetical protein